MRRHLSASARRLLLTIRAEQVAAIDDLQELVGLPGAVFDDLLGELLDAGEVDLVLVGGREAVIAQGEGAE